MFVHVRETLLRMASWELLCGAVLLAVTQLWKNPSGGNLVGELLIFATIALVKFPGAWALIPLLWVFELASFSLFNDLLLTIFYAYLAVELAVFVGRWRQSLVLSVAWLAFVAYFSIYELRESVWLPTFGFNLLLLSAAFGIGWLRRDSALKQVRLRKSYAALESETRQNLSSLLHDTVSHSLTAIVMKSETESVKTSDSNSRRAFVEIGDLSRNTIADMAALVKSLSSGYEHGDSNAVLSYEPPVKALQRMISVLRHAGFTVVLDIGGLKHSDADSSASMPLDSLTDSATSSFPLIANELASNILKHGDTADTVEIQLTLESDCALDPVPNCANTCELSIVNGVLDEKLCSRKLPSTKIGLDSIRRRAHYIGGDVRVFATDRKFQTVVQLPTQGLCNCRLEENSTDDKDSSRAR